MQAIRSKTLLRGKQEAGKSIEQKKAEAIEKKYQKEIELQRKQYYSYIISKRKIWDTSFLKGMQEHIEKKEMLSEKMVQVLKDMQVKDRTYEASKIKQDREAGKPVATLGVLVKRWWATKNQLNCRTFTFDVYVETPRAYKVKGTADIIEGTFCFRCGKQLTEVASQTIGFGEICAKKVGVPYPVNIVQATKEERDSYREKVQKIVKDVAFEGWLPKSMVSEVISYKEVK